jgi:hypothetical protein
MKSLIPCFLLSLFVLTGCQTLKSALYEPIPYDEVAKEQGITLAEAEALNLQRPRAALQPILQATTVAIPDYGQLASVTLNGALALGAIWLGRKKRTADKVATSLVQGIDTFRDILDQTPQGEKIDARLTQTLRDRQNALRVEREIHHLLERYSTPTKSPIPLEPPAQRAS